MIELLDDLSRTIRLEAPARRIVSLVPSITETLFALGAGERIAGITDYCIHPEDQVGTKPKVGGTKNFSVSRILELKPDLVVANAEENRKHQVDALEDAGLRVFVTFPKSVDGCLKMITDAAALTGTSEAAQGILASIYRSRIDARARSSDPPARVLCPVWKDPYMTINGDTFIDNVIRSCGGRNIFADSPERYPKFSLAEAARGQPDIVLLPTEPYHFTEVDIPGIEEMGDAIPACRNHRIYIVEGELLSWYGPRLARALSEISILIASCR